MEKSAKTKRRLEELTAEVSKLRRIAEEQASILECSICKTLPRDGPVPCCPRGHFVCSPCLKQWQESQANRNTCPTCRCSMGTGKSLLAVTVIKHALHSCSNLNLALFDILYIKGGLENANINIDKAILESIDIAIDIEGQ